MQERVRRDDPATFEIVKNSLYKTAEEMRVVLAKTAYSPLLKSAGDYSCGVFDARGGMVAQGPDLPIHLGSMPDAVRAVVAAFAADVHEGDVFIQNDPYCSGQLVATMAQVMDYSERLMRSMLIDLPDGEGFFEDYCDGDGIADDES